MDGFISKEFDQSNSDQATQPDVAWDGSAYASASGGQHRWALENLAKMDLPDDSRVLDLGCGDGKVTAHIASLVSNGYVIGVDYSEDMIDYAKRIHRTHNLGFKVGNAADLKFEHEFDRVFSNSTLHWVRNHDKVFEGLGKATVANAKIWLSMGGLGTASAFYTAIEELERDVRWRRWLADVDHPLTLNKPDQYPKWLEAAHFEPVRIELRPRPMIQPSIDALRGWVNTTKRYYIDRVPKDRREAFIDEVVTRIEADSDKNEDGHYLMKMVNLEIEATRR